MVRYQINKMLDLTTPTLRIINKRRDKRELFATHYFNELPPQSGFLQLSLLTATSVGLVERRYFMGNDTGRHIPESVLESQIAEGSLVKLFPVLIKHPDIHARSLWMDPAGIVYIADAENPWSDREKEAVYDSKNKKSLI